MNPLSRATSVIIRYAMCLVFLWFGVNQLTHPASWVAFLPQWTGYFPIPGEMLIRLNGWFEVIFALLLAAGVYTRIAAFLLGAHLLVIALDVGGAIGVRDAGLSITTMSLALSHPDDWTIDARANRASVDAMPPMG